MLSYKTVNDVAAWRLCVGCGACAYACPEGKIQVNNIEAVGIRPVVKDDHCGLCDDCLKVCPGVGVNQEPKDTQAELLEELYEGWGPIIEVWEGYAANKDVRFQGSSGGLTSALALYCIEQQHMAGVLHIAGDSEAPWRNRTEFSRNISEVLGRTGSRYSPASPCDGLAIIEAALDPAVFIGKGCDVAGVRKASSLRTELASKIGVAIGIFCAGTPTTKATLNLLNKLSVDQNSIGDLRYRGKGWPGNFTVSNKNWQPSVSIPYMEAWGFLQKYRPFRCYLCPDSTAELADISCGDPWYREKRENELGYSLVLVRTARGRGIIRGAIEAGYVVLEKREPKVLLQSQRGMLEKRGAIWGRLLAMKIFGIPTPQYNGFYLYENWKRLSLKEKTRSFLGTFKRIIQRKYYLPFVNAEIANKSNNDGANRIND